MNTRFDFGSADRDIVYVKQVQVADLPAEVQEHAGGAEVIYAVHSANGDQLALVADRTLAFVLARQHDKHPVAVH